MRIIIISFTRQKYLEYVKQIENASSLDSQGKPIDADTRGLVEKVAEKIFTRDEKTLQENNWRFAQHLIADVSARFYDFCFLEQQLTCSLKERAKKYKTGDMTKDWNLSQRSLASFFVGVYNKYLDSTNIHINDIRGTA